jgi:hypothetical protein
VGIPERNEAADYYYKYIDRITSPDVVGVLETQLEEFLGLLAAISEEKSLHRYAPDKWSIRQLVNHVSDTERVFAFRAFWFGRGFDSPLPGFDEKVSAGAAQADEISWARHLEELRGVRLATATFFRNLPAEAWSRRGIASGNPFTVRAIAYILAGHLDHHVGILRERYL